MRLGRVKIGISFFILCAVLIIVDSGWVLLTFAAAAAVHELGHLLVLRAHAKVTGVLLTAAGVSMEVSSGGGYAEELTSAMAGPIASFGFSLITAILWKKTWALSWASLILGAFNLLPALPLDGGRALYALTAAMRGPERARAVTRFSTIITAALLFVPGILLFWRTGGNFTLLAASCYLALRCALEKNGDLL